MRAACGRRTFVPAMRLVERRAGDSGPGGKDVAEHRLAVGGAPFGRLARPLRRPAFEVRMPPRLVGGEQVGAPVPCSAPAVQPVDRQSGKLRLRLDVALVRPPSPASARHPPARWHADAFQVAAADPVFRLRNPGARGSGQQGKGLLAVPLFDSRTALRRAAAGESGTVSGREDPLPLRHRLLSGHGRRRSHGSRIPSEAPAARDPSDTAARSACRP